MSELLEKVERELESCKENYFWTVPITNGFGLVVPHIRSDGHLVEVSVEATDEETIVISTTYSYHREVQRMRERISDGFVCEIVQKVLGKGGYLAENGRLCFICSLEELWIYLRHFLDSCVAFDSLCRIFGYEHKEARKNDVEAVAEEKREQEVSSLKPCPDEQGIETGRRLCATAQSDISV